MKQLCVLTLGLTLVVVFALFISTTFSAYHLIQLLKINFSALETVDKLDELTEGYLVVYSSMISVVLFFLGSSVKLVLELKNRCFFVQKFFKYEIHETRKRIFYNLIFFVNFVFFVFS